MTESSGSSQGEVSKKCAIILGAVTGLFFVLFIIFVFMYASSGSSSKDLDEANKKIEKKDSEIKSLNQTVIDYSVKIAALNTEIVALKANKTDLTNKSTILNNTVTTQAAELESLKKINLYLWIGAGSSLGLGLGATGYGVYELLRANNLSTTLNTTVERGIHLKKYYDRSYMWLIEDYVLYFQAAYMDYNLLFDTVSDGWKKEDFVKKLANRKDTVTFIMTEKDWLIAGIMKSPWTSDGTYTRDDDSFLMSVNRVEGAFMPSWEVGKPEKAGRINGTGLIEFGDKEVFVGYDKLGTSEADRTYYHFDSKSTNKTFYAGEPTFTVKWIQVFQFEILFYGKDQDKPKRMREQMGRIPFRGRGQIPPQ